MWGQGEDFGGGGGGFMSPGGFSSPAPSSSQAPKKSRNNNIIPVTCAEIHSCSVNDGTFKTLNDTIELSQVTVVGVVTSVVETPTRIDYEIDDKTGLPLEVKQFVDNDENSAEEEKIKPIRENTYVRIYGNLRAFQNKRTLAAFKVVPITDMNELTTHILEIIQSRLYFAVNQKGGNPAVGGGMEFGSTSNAMDSTNTGGFQNGLTSIQNQVQTIIASCNTEEGLHVQTICEQLRGVPEKQIREAIEFLCNEGHIFSSVDDDHFKTTDS